jgi:uncharacterized protein (DUF433 family)
MNLERQWQIWSPPKQEAIEVRERLPVGPRHQVPQRRLPKRKEHGAWDTGEVRGSKFWLLHEQWLAERWRQATLALNDCVEISPNKLHGVPVFRGTRFSVSQFFTELGDSEAVKGIADDFELDEAVLRKFLHALAVQLNRPSF